MSDLSDKKYPRPDEIKDGFLITDAIYTDASWFRLCFSLFIDPFKINQRTYSKILKSHKIKHNFIILNGLKFINQSLLFILQQYHFK